MGQDRTRQACDVAIIGTGPYGLSLAAHLRARGVNFRIFGKPMDLWRSHMPKGMMLKSDGFASNLSAPDRHSTLNDFCQGHGKPYADQGLPIPLTDFIEYADWFRARHVPDVEETMVTRLDRTADGFLLDLDTGERLIADRVVLAVGITWFAKIPAELSQLPSHFVSHSYDHRTVDQFKGREVVVVGAGASAINLAYELTEVGSSVRLLARSNQIEYQEPPDPEAGSLLHRLQHPPSPVGPGWRSFFCSALPSLFYRLPASLQARAIRSHLRPSGGWYMREKVQEQVPSVLGRAIEGAYEENGRAHVRLAGLKDALVCDHVIAATGYQIDWHRLPFLSPELRCLVSRKGRSPLVSTREPLIYSHSRVFSV